MASSYTGLGTELMTTGENAGTWGSTTNTNLQIIEQISGGYVEQSIAGSAQTTTLSVSDGSTGATLGHRIIKFTGTITGNQIVTIPLDVQQMYIVVNGTSGAYTVQFKYASGSGSSVTFAATDKGTKLLYAAADHASNPNLVDSGIGSTAGYDLDGNELTLDADSDTSITASTDDQIDFEIAGADDFTMTANAFNVLTGSHATFADSANAKFGTGNDMLVYHDGSNSYITNATGALKLATETSGIAITLGHSTSEVTVADNLTVTGTLTGTLATAAQGTVTSLGTLTTLTVDNVITNGTTIGHTDDTDLMTLADGVLTVAGELDATTLDISGNADIDGTTNLDAVDIDGAVQLDSTFTVGADDQGYDIKFFGDTASAYMLWDTSADDLVLAGAAGIDLAGDIDVDGTANLDAVDIDGAVQIDGATTVGVDGTGLDVKFFGDTAGSFLLWDQSADALLLTDSTPIQIGDAQDLTLYHDGSNSYITNAVGALKIATETSGIALTIGHTTSETTIADNATITGNLSVGGNFDVTGTLDFSDSDITNIGSIALDTITNDGTDITLDSSGDIVLDAGGADITLKDDGTTFGSLVNNSGNLLIKSGSSPTTTMTIDGSQKVTFAGDIGIADDAFFNSDSAEIRLGASNEIKLIHVANTGLSLKHTATADDKPIVLTLQTGETDIAVNDVIGTLNFQAPDEAQGTDAILVAAGIEAVSEGDFSSTSNATKLSFKTAASEAAAEKMSLSSGGNLTVSGDITLGDDLVLDSDSCVLNFGDDQDTTLTHTDGTGLTLNSTNKLTFGDTATYINQSSDGVMTVAGEATIDLTASTAVLVSNDLKLDSDSSVIGFGADNDTTLTHTDGTGLTLNSTNKICFNDTSQFIYGVSNAILGLGATDEIDLTATAIDINGTCDISGTFSLAGTNITATAAELNYCDGVTSAIQTQLDAAASTGKAIAMAIVFG